MQSAMNIPRTYTYFSFVFMLPWLWVMVHAPEHHPSGQHPAMTPLDEPVQVGIPGQFTGTFAYLNAATNGPLDINNNGVPDIYPPCSCRSYPEYATGVNLDNRVFDDQVVVATGISGQTWKVKIAGNMLKPATLDTLANGVVIPEVGQTGVYVLKFAHREITGYLYIVESPTDYPGQTFGPVENHCYYPDAKIELLADEYCDVDPAVSPLATVTSAYDNNFLPLTPVEELWTITRVENNQSYITSTFSPTSLGGGHYRVRYTFTGNNHPNQSPVKTGCNTTVYKDVYVHTTVPMICHSSLNLTLNPNTCIAKITPSMILTSNPTDIDHYTITIEDEDGHVLGDTITSALAGQTVEATIYDHCTGLSCTTLFNVTDNTAPTLTVPPNITIPCTGDYSPASTGYATATDCTPVNVTYTDQWIESVCNNPKVRINRTWKATDAGGLVSTKLQVISISRATQNDFLFPTDKEYTCEQYAANPAIIEAATLGAGIPTLVDNPLCGLIYTHQDNVIPLCGNPQTSFFIIRTWTVLDECGITVYTTDGGGNDNVQLIRVRDVTPPTVATPTVTVGSNLSPLDTGLPKCSSTGLIPAPVVTDACNDFTIQIFTPLGEAVYVNGQDGAQGGYIPAPGLQLGQHTIQYKVKDACDNIRTVNATLIVEDQQLPQMICNSLLNVSLASNGLGQVTPAMIDEGSRDDCCVDQLLIKLIDEDDSQFRPNITFYCTNATTSVIMRMWDCAGHFNDCEATLIVEDRQKVTVGSQPADRTFTCQADISAYFAEDYDAPVFLDNCQFEVEFTIDDQRNSCGIGQLIRTWTARDNPNNQPAVVHQTITATGVFTYSIFAPADATVSCGGSVSDTMAYATTGCDFLTYSLISETPAPGGGQACHRIIRTHQVINWCEYDGVTDPYVLPRSNGEAVEFSIHDGDVFWVFLPGDINLDPATGIYRYEQWVDIVDNGAPVVTAGSLGEVCTDAGCLGAVQLDISVQDNCQASLQVQHKLQFNGQLQADPYGQLTPTAQGYRIAGLYPIGEYAVVITAVDECGNAGTKTVPFQVSDCTPPSLTCAQNLAFEVFAEQPLVLTPEMAGVTSDACGDVLLGFGPDGAVGSLQYDCDSIGVRTVQLFAQDPNGNTASCTAQISIETQPNGCERFFTIRGFIQTETGQPVANVLVKLNTPVPQEQLTDFLGYYEFVDVPEGGTYKLEVAKDLNAINGVTTFDVIQITRHILAEQFLSSPYKMIAADANKSKVISTLDLVHIRRVVLHINENFSNNTSWRFVPASYNFLDPTNPFGENFPETVVIQALDDDMTVNFTAIKIGDVNDSVNGQN